MSYTTLMVQLELGRSNEAPLTVTRALAGRFHSACPSWKDLAADSTSNGAGRDTQPRTAGQGVTCTLVCIKMHHISRGMRSGLRVFLGQRADRRAGPCFSDEACCPRHRDPGGWWLGVPGVPAGIELFFRLLRHLPGDLLAGIRRHSAHNR